MHIKKGDIVEKLVNIGILLSQEKNLRKLLNKIVEEVINFTGAEGGSLYIKKGNTLHFMVFKNRILEERVSPDLLKKRIKKSSFEIKGTSIAGACVKRGEIIAIPDMDRVEELGFKYDRGMDKDLGYKTKSLLSIPLKGPQGEIIGVLQIVNLPEGSFEKEELRLARAMASQAAIALSNALLLDELKNAQLDTIYRLSRVAEFKDRETGDHIRRMSLVSKYIASAMKNDPDFIELILYASPMHDIGKVAIPDSILLKPARLTKQEFEIMKTHTKIGAEILKGAETSILKVAYKIALYHHEKYNGTGYPEGLKGYEIPIEARVVAVADVFDALVSKRPYKGPWPLEKAEEFIVSQKGQHFDPVVVEAFIKVYDKIISLYQKPGTLYSNQDLA